MKPQYYKCDTSCNLQDLWKLKLRIDETSISVMEDNDIHFEYFSGKIFRNDNIVKYNFDIIDFDTSQCSNLIMKHTEIYGKKEDVMELLEYLQLIWGDNCCIRHFKTKHYSTCSLYYGTKWKRGIWKSKNETDIKYPICILSYGRYTDTTGYTHLTLCRSKIKHNIFVEPCEYDYYDKWINKEFATLIKVSRNFHEEKMGSCLVRNYILDWGYEKGYDRVWMLDDNIKRYSRYYNGFKDHIEGNHIFTSIENYISTYDNVGCVSHNFHPFIVEGQPITCLVKNGKCFSSLLILTRHDLRFRGKYNEDHIYSMECIEKGLCNLCFNHILYDKATSGLTKGGNAQGLYKCKTSTNGSGYKDKYNYMVHFCNLMKLENKLTLKKDKTIDDLIQPWKLQSKDHHARVYYNVLYNHGKNDIHKINNSTYDKCDFDFILMNK